jgi:hypothetical protein
MDAFICTACGTQFSPAEAPPPFCPICEDERQFLPPSGQGWTTLEKLAATHANVWRQHEPGILGIGTEPTFAIGQRALLLRTAHGNVLWDCVSLLDDATVTLIEALGGVQAMAISHPHFYTTMVEWARAFDVPVHLHAADRAWIVRPEPTLELWDGETLPLLPGVTLIRGGGHFPGAAMLHWAQGADGRGVVCSSDTAMVAADRKSLSFMRSYPNLIPLPARAVETVAAALAPFAFDRIYGILFDRVIPTGAKQALEASIARYLAAVGAGGGGTTDESARAAPAASAFGSSA